MQHINSFLFVSTSLKNLNIALAMVQFFALYKQKITSYPTRHFILKLVLDKIDFRVVSQKVFLSYFFSNLSAANTKNIKCVAPPPITYSVCCQK